MSVAKIAEEIQAEKTQIVWVLESTSSLGSASAEDCVSFAKSNGITLGICLGDNETLPVAGDFDRSELANGRGFDIIVDRSNMQIKWNSTHGTSSGDENISGADVLQAVKDNL